MRRYVDDYGGQWGEAWWGLVEPRKKKIKKRKP